MKIALSMLVAACLTACGKPETVNPRVGESASASTVATSICEYESAVPVGVVGVAKVEGRSICLTMGRVLGRQPSAATLAAMENMLFVMRANFDYQGKPADLTSQVMSIVRARGQLDAPDSAITSTLDLVWKCYSGTQGRLTIPELASNMVAAGEVASKLSDDGFLRMCAVFDATKR